MASVVSRSPTGDIQILRDPRRSQPIHLTYVMLGFLVSGLLAPIVSAPGLWRLTIGHTVYVSIDGQTRSYASAQQTVANVLREGKILIGPGDRVTPALDSKVWTGIQVSVVRSVPFTVTVGGIRRQARVPAATVSEALSLLNVEIGPHDQVFPDLSATLAPGMRVTVIRRETRTWVEHTPIPFSVQTVPDRTVLKGQQVVRTAGQPGARDRTVRVEYADGRPVTMQALSETIVRQPVAKVVAIGTKPNIATVGAYAGKEILYLEATAYYPGPNNFGGGVGPKTAIGLIARRGIVAVDPSVIKLGTHLYIEGYGEAVAGDTGGAIQGSRIDLCFDTYDEAMRFGRRSVKLYILKGP
jgi:3D (Asp-Asp-Asp) domain-containing protein